MATKDSDRTQPVSNNVALICGVTGIVGRELARQLVSEPQWKVYGIARKPDIIPINDQNYHYISCDLLDSKLTQQKLSTLQDVTHVFWVTWATGFPLDTPECCEQNKAMMSNALNAILPNAKSLKHFSLQTGTKHYVLLQGKFDEKDCYNEDCPRVGPCYNFYYSLEDLLKERLTGEVAWTVQRPGLITGCSNRTLYNFMGSLCVYGTICKHLNLPFLFGGSRKRWEEHCIDGSDARLVAEQHIWASTNEEISVVECQVFNAVNGTYFTWKEIWPLIAARFGLAIKEGEQMFSEEFFFSKTMSDKGEIWEEIVEKEGLLPTKMEDLANWDFLDSLFRWCQVKIVTTREKSDKLGFTTKYKMSDSILYWIDFMRHEKMIP